MRALAIAGITASMLMPLPARAQQSQSVFTCDDVKFEEPGWTCHTHFGYSQWDFQPWMTIVGHFSHIDLDSTGAMYYPTGFDWNLTGSESYCNGLPIGRAILLRYLPGFGPEHPELGGPFATIPAKCVNGHLIPAAITDVAVVADDHILAVVFTARHLMQPHEMRDALWMIDVFERAGGLRAGEAAEWRWRVIPWLWFYSLGKTTIH